MKAIESATGAHLKKDGNGPLSRRQSAEEAGLSERQQKTAIRVANVPEEAFEAHVESDSPPTVTALAEQGTRKKPLHDLEGIDPNLFKLATRAIGLMDNFAKFVETAKPSPVGLCVDTAIFDGGEIKRGSIRRILTHWGK